MIAYIAKFLKALNANVNPGEIAHAASCGFLLGLVPKDNLLWYLLFVFLFFIRINKPTYLIMILVGTALTPALDPTVDSIGYSILTIENFRNFYAFLLDVPFVAFTKFNNTIVMGSLALGLICYIPVYIIARVFVKLWRKYAAVAIKNSRIVKALYQIPIVSKIVSLIEDRI